MMLTMLYALVIAALLGFAALFAERLLGELGRARRFVWIFALAASVAIPAYSVFFDVESAESSIVSLPQTLEFLPRLVVPEMPTTTSAAPAAQSWLSWPDWRFFNSALIALWIVSSTAMLLICALAGLGLRRLARRSESMTIDNQTILLSDDLGPAVFGIFDPRIVLPRWLAERDSRLRRFVLVHEREHIAAHDQVLLCAALILVACMPFNAALWWQLRRLRSAIEVDCDARVLRKGTDAREYSKALLIVGQHYIGTPLGAVALTEPVSELEQRIRIMLERTRRLSLSVIGSRLTLAVAVTVLALAVNAPNAQDAADDPEYEIVSTADGDVLPGSPPANAKVIPTIRTPVYEDLNAAQQCLDADNFDCARRALDRVGAMTDLNGYETAQLYNFSAFMSFEQDDRAGATRAYESLLGLPRDQMPDGLVSVAMRNVATLYLEQERYQDGLDTFEEWMDLTSTTPTANDHYLKATIYYQMENYDEMIPSVEEAIEMADAPAENFYQLLYVGQYQTGDIDGAVETLELLNQQWPKEAWAKALEGLQLVQDQR